MYIGYIRKITSTHTECHVRKINRDHTGWAGAHLGPLLVAMGYQPGQREPTMRTIWKLRAREEELCLYDRFDTSAEGGGTPARWAGVGRGSLWQNLRSITSWPNRSPHARSIGI
jgi:hypothetical protein